jgi:type II secretory pathway pseudopilin PulG
LLETLVALAVLGVVLATLFRLAGDSLVQHQSRESRLRLALTAEAALNAARLGADGVASGSWPLDLTVSVERHDLAAAAAGGLELPPAAAGDDTLDWLTVTVVDADGRSFALSGIVGRQRR